MNEKLEFVLYQKKNKIREYKNYRFNQIFSDFFNKPYAPEIHKICGRNVMGCQETNDYIFDKIKNGAPFWAGRYGRSEMCLMVAALEKRFEISDNVDGHVQRLCDLSGFFPYNIECGERFVDCMLECCKNIDLHAVWPMYMEDYFIKKYEGENVEFTKLSWLEPWTALGLSDYADIVPWTSALEGKKVLVIHPFEDSIKNQYNKNRDKIFDGLNMAGEILPKFELKTIKAVQTIAGEKDERFATWFDALEYMTDECKRIDFDVAIIGCGAYGFPLAANVKNMGKIAIHMGGATQIMFGIIGNRWRNNNKLMSITNDAWVTPLESEKPSKAASVENGCYW